MNIALKSQSGRTFQSLRSWLNFPAFLNILYMSLTSLTFQSLRG